MSSTHIFTTHAKDAPWLAINTILYVRVGSKSYGLDTAESDDDFAGVAFPPLAQLLGLESSFEQKSIKAPDSTIFEYRKFLTQALQGNPAFLDILFSDQCAYLNPWAYQRSEGDWLRKNRDAFLSQRMTPAFLGYAASQIRRYCATGSAKAAMHSIRALRMLRETHQTGRLQTQRTEDREELLGIRSGKVSREVILAQAAYEEALAKEAEKHSVLLKEPMTALVQEHCMDTLRGWVHHCRTTEETS